MRLPLLAMFVALCGAVAASPSPAGEWLGGQYWGQISGCGYCGGSLYGLGYGYGCPHCGQSEEVWQEEVPTPLPAPHTVDEIPSGEVRDIPDPQVPESSIIRTSHVREAAPSSRRTFQEILPIAPAQTGGAVQTIRHQPQPERLAPPRDRIVAPNAWSGRLYR